MSSAWVLKRAPVAPIRLVAFDFDSTLAPIEVIDELARLHGVFAEVRAITAAAMRGELDFAASFSQRVAMLRGLELAKVDAFVAQVQLRPGAETLLRELKEQGVLVGIISGSFLRVVDPVRQRLGLDFAFAHSLDAENGLLTGLVKETVIDAQKKSDLLRQVAIEHAVPLESTAAVGDGANDINMIQTAGLGIAFEGKPALNAVADGIIEYGGFESLRVVFGTIWSREDLGSSNTI